MHLNSLRSGPGTYIANRRWLSSLFSSVMRAFIGLPDGALHSPVNVTTCDFSSGVPCETISCELIESHHVLTHFLSNESEPTSPMPVNGMPIMSPLNS